MKRIALAIILLIVTIYTIGQVQPRLVLPVGHTDRVNSVSFSLDEKYVVTASDDNTVKIWDVSSGRELQILQGHTDKVNSASFSLDGKYLVTASWDKTARIWDVNSGKVLRLLQGHTKDIKSASFSPNGKYVLTASRDSTARLWEASTGELLNILKAQTDENVTASFSSDGKYILTYSFDRIPHIWDVYSGKLLQNLQGHTKSINSAFFSQDGRFVVTASDDSTSRIWDVLTGKQLQIFQGHSDVISFASFSSDGKFVVTATASYDNIARIFEVKSGKEIHSIKGIDRGIDGIRTSNYANFSPDGKYLLTYLNYDNKVHIRDVYSGDELYSLYGSFNSVEYSSFSNSGKYLVTISLDNSACIWDFSKGKEFHTLRGHTSWVNSPDINPNGLINIYTAFMSPDRKKVLTASGDNTAQLWEVLSGKLLKTLQGHTAGIISASFSPDGKSLVTASYDNSARIWDVSSGKEIHILQGHTSWVRSALFSPDGKYIVTASSDGTARIWEVLTGRLLYILNGNGEEVISASFSSDGKFVLTTTLNNSNAIIWDVSSGKMLNTLQGHTEGIASASFSPDGKLVVTSSYDETARIWEVSSGKELQNLQGHERSINCVSFSQDGRFVVTSSYDETARIWEVSSGKELQNLQGHKSWINCVSFSPNGRYVVSASQDNTARIWDVLTGKILYSLEGHTNRVKFVCFSADGKFVLTLGIDRKAILWDASTGKPLYTRLQLKNNDWLVYDEDYHFDGSEGAINYLYLTCGLEIIDLAQVKDSLWIPGLAGKIMRGEPLLINDKPAPKLSDLNICELTPLVEELPKDAKGNLIFQITPRNGGLGETEVYINGNLTYKYQPEKLVKSKNKEGKIIYTLNLSKDSITPFLSGTKGAVNPVLVKCKIKGASIYSRGVEVEMLTEKDPELPKLYAVFVGVNDYNNTQKESNEYLYKNLDYAAKDAGDLANMVEQSARALFDSSFIYRLTGKSDTEPTKENLKKVLKEIGSKAKANDILYIFFAGHGDIVKFKNDKTNQEKNEIRFMLQGADKRNKNTGGFGVDSLSEWCAPKNIKAQKRVFVFDACHSGQFVNETMAYAQGGRGDEEEVRIRQLTSLKDKNGMMILAASSDDEYAYEDPSLNQGVLTYHLLEAVKDSKDSTLQINKWFESTLDLVKEYATANNKKQTPETFGNGRFEIGNVNKQVRDSIKIGAPKARIGNSVFIDATGKYPNLKKLINEHFKQSGSRGYISATTNEKAYYAEGSVMMDNGKLKILYTLYYGDSPIAEPFSMSELKGLSEDEVVKKIVASVEGGINEYIKKSKK